MRAHAYQKAVQQAKRLPTEVPELARYFKDHVSPRQLVLDHIAHRARHDDSLFVCELIPVLHDILGGIP